MSISSLYSGMSGIRTMSDAMSVVGGNIANIETVGYRSSHVSFQDVFSNTMSDKSAPQTGHGSAIGLIANDFTAGDIEATSSPLDLAISGKGFFVVKQGDYDDTGSFTSTGSDTYYTRAFCFNANKDGYLVNANGYVAQGWAYVADDSPVSNPIDIQFDLATDTYSTEQVTSQIEIISNLNHGAMDKSPGVDGLSGNWDATNYEPIANTAYDLKVSQKIYDTEGIKYIDVYYDRAATDNTWEYLVTYKPTSPTGPNDGLLARGEITFNSETGHIAGMTMDRYSGGWVAQSPDTDTANGHFTFATPLGDGNVEFDIGTAYTDGTWTNDSLTTMQLSANSYAISQSSNGFDPDSRLTSLSVDKEGVILGTYSDGHQTELYRIALGTFQNQYGLSPMGKSLFMATDTSGDPIFFTAGGRTDEYSNMAKIISNALERSNVKVANEFGNMILIQRGFQASAKGVAAADQMLQTAVNLMK